MDNFEEPQDHEDDQASLEDLAEWAIGAAIDIENIVIDGGSELNEKTLITATFNATMLLETLWAFLDILESEKIIDIETLEEIVRARKKLVNVSVLLH